MLLFNFDILKTIVSENENSSFASFFKVLLSFMSVWRWRRTVLSSKGGADETD